MHTHTHTHTYTCTAAQFTGGQQVPTKSPQNHQTVPNSNGIYAVPHSELDTVYDAPVSDAYYADVLREQAVTSSETYKKFDNPLYTLN